MSNRSRAVRIPDGESAHRTNQLRRAADRLEAVLDSLDLEAEAQLADEVVEAVRATDRAFEIQTSDEQVWHRSEEFVFPAARADGGSLHER